MKDLLADLQVQEGDWSLEQLEKELSTLDLAPHPELQPHPTLSAASLVVAHAQELSGGGTSTVNISSSTAQGGLDAWSLSLEKFTALSLEQDFLAADSVRKKQHNKSENEDQYGSVALDGAEDYDVVEKPKIAPPPGLGGSAQIALQNQLIKPDDLMARFEPEPIVTKQTMIPRTPQNSMVVTNTSISDQGLAGVLATTQEVAVPMPRQVEVPPQASAEFEKTVELPPPPDGVLPEVPVPPGHVVMPVADGIMPQQLPPTVHAPPLMTHLPPQMAQPPYPVALPASLGPAWQTPRPPLLPSIRVFCNPHPAAPPVPATALETKYMDARDIAYVVHSILKPVLTEGVSEDDYYIQMLRRFGGPQSNPLNPKHPKDISDEMLSRVNRAKEWSMEKGTLGYVAKTNVARPRALIATPVSASEQDSEQKQRASLWKARIYCDQAYQSYQAVVDIWRSAPPGGVPPQVQVHLRKLMKCMGITLVENQYQVDGEAFKMLIKLSKGRTLLARTLEQALLPPNAVQSLLPVALDILLACPTRKDDSMIDDRLFRSIAGVFQRLNLSNETLLECVQALQSNGKSAHFAPNSGEGSCDAATAPRCNRAWAHSILAVEDRADFPLD